MFVPVEVVVVGAGQAGLAIKRSIVIRNKPERMWFWRRALRSAVPGDTGVGTPLHPGDTQLVNSVAGLPLPRRRSRWVHEARRNRDLSEAIRGQLQDARALWGDGYGHQSRAEWRLHLVPTAGGDIYAASNVVVATGSFQFPKPTKLAEAFPPNILQMHSSSYRSPDGLPSGAVLVVGSADTGCQITEELYESDRQVYLCVGRSARRPRRYRGKDVVFWSVTLGGMNQTADQLPDPSVRFVANPHLTGKNGGYTPQSPSIRTEWRGAVGPSRRCARQHHRAGTGPARKIWPSPTRDRTISKAMSMRSSERTAWTSPPRNQTRSMRSDPMLPRPPPRPLIFRPPVSPV